MNITANVKLEAISSWSTYIEFKKKQYFLQNISLKNCTLCWLFWRQILHTYEYKKVLISKKQNIYSFILPEWGRTIEQKQKCFNAFKERFSHFSHSLSSLSSILNLFLKFPLCSHGILNGVFYYKTIPQNSLDFSFLSRSYVIMFIVCCPCFSIRFEVCCW